MPRVHRCSTPLVLLALLALGLSARLGADVYRITRAIETYTAARGTPFVPVLQPAAFACP